VKLLAKVLGIAPSSFELVTGATSREKTLRIADVNTEVAKEALNL